MKYNHLLIISLIIPSIISGMGFKRTSSVTKTTTKAALAKLICHEKTVITAAHQPNSHDVSIESTDQDFELGIDNTHEISPRKNKLIKQASFERL
jgi:hypothetical protein